MKKVELKLKPQSAATGYTSGYVKKPVIENSNFDKVRQQKNQLQKEYENTQVPTAVKESFQLDNDDSLDDLIDNDDDNDNDNEVVTQNKVDKKTDEKKEILLVENEKNKIVEKSTVAARTMPIVSTSKPVYVKLKRREENYDYDGEGSGNGKKSENGDIEIRNFDSLEALDDRMDELYGDLDLGSKIPVDQPPQKVEISLPRIPKAEFNDGSDSKNPIKWRNGRLVSDKDRFHDQIRDTFNSENENESVINSDDSKNDRNTEVTIKKTTKKKVVNNKVVVELTGVTTKKMLEYLETTIGFEGLYEETNLRCFSEKPSINSSLKVLRQLPLEWARKKIEYLYIQSKKLEVPL